MKTLRLLTLFIMCFAAFGLCVAQPGAVGPREAPGVAAVKNYFNDALKTARERLDSARDYDGALAIAQSVRTLAPTQEIAKDAADLIDAIENERIQKVVLESELSTDRALYQAGDKIILIARLYNRSMNAVKIPLRLAQKTSFIFWKKNVTVPNIISVKLTSMEYDYLGGRIEATSHESEEFSEEISLQPGEFWEKKIELSMSEQSPRQGSVRDLKIELLFSPIFYTIDEKPRAWRQFNTVSARVLVLPRGAAVVGKEPVLAATEALAKQDGVNLLYAVICAGKVERARLVKPIIDQLRDAMPNSPFERSLIVCLQHITGFYGRLQKNMWLEWWRDRGEDFVRSARPEAQPLVIKIDIAADGVYTYKGERKSLADLEALIGEARTEGLLEVVASCAPDAKFASLEPLRQLCKKLSVERVHFLPAEEPDGSAKNEQ